MHFLSICSLYASLRVNSVTNTVQTGAASLCLLVYCACRTQNTNISNRFPRPPLQDSVPVLLENPKRFTCIPFFTAGGAIYSMAFRPKLLPIYVSHDNFVDFLFFSRHFTGVRPCFMLICTPQRTLRCSCPVKHVLVLA